MQFQVFRVSKWRKCNTNQSMSYTSIVWLDKTLTTPRRPKSSSTSATSPRTTWRPTCSASWPPTSRSSPRERRSYASRDPLHICSCAIARLCLVCCLLVVYIIYTNCNKFILRWAFISFARGRIAYIYHMFFHVHVQFKYQWRSIVKL